MPHEKYQPTPQEVNKAEDMMSGQQRYLSKVREYASKELTEDELRERFEKDGERYEMEGFFTDVEDEKLGKLKLFHGF